MWKDYATLLQHAQDLKRHSSSSMQNMARFRLTHMAILYEGQYDANAQDASKQLPACFRVDRSVGYVVMN